jgi:hypothetical protein
MPDPATVQRLVDQLAAHSNHTWCAACGRHIGRRQLHQPYLDAWEQLVIAGQLAAQPTNVDRGPGSPPASDDGSTELEA